MKYCYIVENLYDYNGSSGRYIARVCSSYQNCIKYIKSEYTEGHKIRVEKTGSGWREINSPFTGSWHVITKNKIDA